MTTSILTRVRGTAKLEDSLDFSSIKKSLIHTLKYMRLPKGLPIKMVIDGIESDYFNNHNKFFTEQDSKIVENKIKEWVTEGLVKMEGDIVYPGKLSLKYFS